MKIIVFTDVHANLPALQAALKNIKQEGYDAIFHTGDAIGIGPFPAECVDLLLNTPRIHFVMGNHDAWFADGLPTPRPSWMGEGEVQHQLWTHAQFDPHLRTIVAQWTYRLHIDFEGVATSFLHYGLDSSGRNWSPIVRQPNAADLDLLFANEQSQLVFYGHHHPAADTAGRARYVNPGSLGCYHLPLARYSVVEFQHSGFTLTQKSIPYEDQELFQAFESRQVPERTLIYRAFFGNRFPL